ncbi:MAG TPA: translocation/assembly module TamB domain-containing protein [Bacteroidales bacterium]|nr:translocation/assembly module TamB domain-containing protein [Bacteroidales bacterium]
MPNTDSKITKKRSYGWKVIFAVVLLTPIFGYAVFQSSGVQTYLAKRIAANLSKNLNTSVRVGGLDITFFLNFVLEELAIDDQSGNPMISAQRAILDIKKVGLFRRNLEIKKVLLDGAQVNLTRYQGQEDFNFRFLTDFFKPTQPKENKWNISCNSVGLRGSGLAFHDLNKPERNNGFDPAHFALTHVYLDLGQISLQADTLSFLMRKFSFEKSGGFSLKNLSGKWNIDPITVRAEGVVLETPKSSLNLEAKLDFEGLEPGSGFFENSKMRVAFENSVINLGDLGYFLPSLNGMDANARLEGSLSGTLANMRANDFVLEYGNNTWLTGDFHLMGLPNIDNTFFNLDLNQLQTSVGDLNNIRLPARSQNDYLNLPKTLASLGSVSFQGRVTGFINDLVAYGTLNSEIGKISTDLRMLKNHETGLPAYKGRIITEGFDLGRFFGDTENIGLITLDAGVEGQGLTRETINMVIDGNIGSVAIIGYNYENVEISGNLTNQMFHGSLLIDDPNVFLDFNGLINFEEDSPVFDFKARLERANLSRLNIFQPDSLHEAIVSGLMDMNIQSWKPYNIRGKIQFDELAYEINPVIEGESTYFPIGQVNLSSSVNGNGKQMLTLRSDFVQAEMEGTFRLDRFGHAIRTFVYEYLPAFRGAPPTEPGQDYSFTNTTFNLTLKNTNWLSEAFFPTVSIAEGTTLKGVFGQLPGQLTIEGFSNELLFSGVSFEDVSLKGRNVDQTYLVELKSRQANAINRFSMDQFSFTGEFSMDSLQYKLHWNSPEATVQNYGRINGFARFIDQQRAEVRIFHSNVMLNDSLWTINPGNRIMIDSNKLEIRTLLVTQNEAYLLADGILSSNPADYMLVEVNELDAANLSKIINARNLNFEGMLSGFVTLGSLTTSPRIETDLYVTDFAFNFDHLGDLQLRSFWDNKREGFNISLEIIYFGNVGFNTPLAARGYFYPGRKDNNFDIDILAENLKMSIWSRYLESFASGFRGLASGRLRLDGPMNDPALTGRLRIARAGLRINFLNTSYTFTNDLIIEHNQFVFDNLVLNDTLGNSGTITGRIMHNDFRDWALDISVNPNRMAIMNTSPSHRTTMFYGRAFGSGVARIHGPVNNLALDIRAQTNRGTQIFLPLDMARDVAETNFITFVNHNVASQVVVSPATNRGNLSLNLELEVTPDAEVQLIIDSRTGDIIRGRGHGNLTMDLPAGGNFSMMGDFTIGEGDYLFNLQNLINKRFRIVEGGTIRWTGDPLDADVDISAVYRTRTTLHDLFMNLDTSEVYRRRVPVETHLALRGKLFNPTISFDIALPGADENTREMLSRVITTEQEVNRQVFSLLILNRFMPSSIDQYNTALGFGVGSTSSELLSNQLSNWLSQISNDFDIGINYRPGDLISSQELEVALSTQLFNERVTIDGNLGVAGNNPALGVNQRTSNIIGDVNVEVKITPEGRFRVRAFNRHNSFEVLDTQAPYTRGIGVFYRREFDSLGELLRRRRRIESIAPSSAETYIP